MKRKYTNEEVRRWMEERNSRFFYINGEDTNIFVRKYYGIGWTLNLGNPCVIHDYRINYSFNNGYSDILYWICLLKD